MNKKAKQPLLNVVIMIVLTLIVFFSIYYFFMRTGDNLRYEEIYAKEIALIIDSAKSGMEINLSIDKPLEISEKNKIETSEIFTINKNFVQIKIVAGPAYRYSFFNNVKPELVVYAADKILNIKIKEVENE